MVLLLSVISALCIIFFSYAIYLKSRLFSKEKELNHLQHLANERQETTTALEQQLHLATFDPVTQLSSWLIFEDRLNQSVKESARYQFGLALLLVEIDDFNVINTALGENATHSLLKEVAIKLQSCIRQVDSISRYYDGTFAILLTQFTKTEMAAIVAQRILQALSTPFKIENQELYITVGIGIALFPADGKEASVLLRHAEHALHLAKVKGKHLFQFFQEKLHINSERELALSSGLRKESLYDEFVIYYQPIVDIKNDSTFCMEMLLRWNHPQLGMIETNELLQHAEKQHKLNLISEWSFKKACEQFKQWHALGFEPHYLGVPIAIKQLEDSSFIYKFSQILQDLQIKPEFLLIEIQESQQQISFDIIEKALNMLKYLGVQIAIDNFGSGPFSLSYLKNMDIRYLKLDPAFSIDMEQNPRAVTLLTSLISLAKNLSMETILQGIESDQQILLAEKLGCHLIQGLKVAPPISEHEIAKKMAHLTQ